VAKHYFRRLFKRGDDRINVVALHLEIGLARGAGLAQRVRYGPSSTFVRMASNVNITDSLRRRWEGKGATEPIVWNAGRRLGSIPHPGCNCCLSSDSAERQITIHCCRRLGLQPRERRWHLVYYPWPEGAVIFARDGPGFVGADGSLAMKWPWWRGVPGKLAIEGRRLDAPAPGLRAEITDGYGDSGFQPISLIFPTQGCWEVTGKVGGARLTFVTLAVKVPFRLITFMGLKSGPNGFVSTRTDTSNLPDSLREIISYSGGGELIRESGAGEQAITTPNPAATQQKVTVQGHPGTCVQGALVNQRWQDNADAATLEWTADGASYRISQKGLGLRCDDLSSMLIVSNWS
jgi:hypothetical protein